MKGMRCPLDGHECRQIGCLGEDRSKAQCSVMSAMEDPDHPAYIDTATVETELDHIRVAAHLYDDKLAVA